MTEMVKIATLNVSDLVNSSSSDATLQQLLCELKEQSGRFDILCLQGISTSRDLPGYDLAHAISDALNMHANVQHTNAFVDSDCLAICWRHNVWSALSHDVIYTDNDDDPGRPYAFTFTQFVPANYATPSFYYDAEDMRRIFATLYVGNVQAPPDLIQNGQMVMDATELIGSSCVMTGTFTKMNSAADAQTAANNLQKRLDETNAVDHVNNNYSRPNFDTIITNKHAEVNFIELILLESLSDNHPLILCEIAFSSNV